MDRLNQLADRLRTVFAYDPSAIVSDETLGRELAEPGPRSVVVALAKDLADGAPLVDRDTFRAAANRVKDRTGQKGKALFHPIRVALTGAAEGPELDLVIPAIERAAALTAGGGLAAVTGCRDRVRALAAELDALDS